MSAVEECYKFAEGDTVLLIDRRRRHYLITLESNAKFHTHIGIADHNAIIGAEFGSPAKSSFVKLLKVDGVGPKDID